MVSREQNDLLTRTGPGTPMGALFRRYWIPALLSSELPAADCPPVRVSLLSEKLVAFRDSQGRLGLVSEFCAHRGVSLWFGRNEESGLRCPYHGWKYDVSGKVVETPAEPNDNLVQQGIQHSAYPTVEKAGIVFAYLGPRQDRPLFPNYGWAALPPTHTYVTKSLQECNWLQGLEGECDSSHLSFLHRTFAGPGSNRAIFTSRAPRYETEQTDFGVRLIATRPLEDGGANVRVSSFVMPLSCWVPARNKEVHMYVPIDDTHSWRYDFGYLDRPANDADWGRRKDLDGEYRKLANASNDYLQDREKQRRENFTGMGSFLTHDSCMTESMGPRYDRTQEYLGMSDLAVVTVRRALLNAVKGLDKGKEPPHLVHDPAKNQFPDVDTFDMTIAKGQDWRAVNPHLAFSRA